jgi:hypothetical protein
MTFCNYSAKRKIRKNVGAGQARDKGLSKPKGLIAGMARSYKVVSFCFSESNLHAEWLRYFIEFSKEYFVKPVMPKRVINPRVSVLDRGQ